MNVFVFFGEGQKSGKQKMFEYKTWLTGIARGSEKDLWRGKEREKRAGEIGT